jgi:cytochrome c peroxidase
MKSYTTLVVVMLFAFIGGGTALAAHHEASIDKGKALFYDPKLGTTGKSCNDCHQNGKGVEKAAGKKDLESMVNSCITQALKGKALDPKSVEMQSIILYINSLKKNQ